MNLKRETIQTLGTRQLSGVAGGTTSCLITAGCNSHGVTLCECG
jgi:hypothetical protein